MKKILTALLMLSLIVVLLACADLYVESDPHRLGEDALEKLMLEKEPDHTSEIESVIIPEPLPEPFRAIESVATQDVTDNTQSITSSTPTETPALIAVPTPKPRQPQTPIATPKPTQLTIATSQTPSQTPTPAPQSTPEPVQQPAPTPQPTPDPTPQPTPQPAPPPPPVAEPPPARTICNTCGADITGNVAAHGTEHMLNDENFSYRVE